MHVVLLPGLDGTGDLFAPLRAALRSPSTVVAYPTDEVLSYDDLEQRLRRELSDPCVLVAESFSSPLALRLSDHPAVRGVVLVAGFARRPRRLPAGIVRLLAPIVFAVPPPRFALRWFLVGASAPRELVATLGSAIRKVRPRVLAARLVAVLRVDVRECLPAPPRPVLYLQGTRDRLVPAAAASELGRPAELIQLDAPHLVLQTAPTEAAAAIDAFVAQTAATGPGDPAPSEG